MNNKSIEDIPISKNFQIIHIEDEVQLWRTVPKNLMMMILKLVSPDDDVLHTVGAFRGDMDKIYQRDFSWVKDKNRYALSYIFVFHETIKELESDVIDDAIFIVDAMRDGQNGRIRSNLSNSLKSIEKHVKNPLISVRIFTAYPDDTEEIAEVFKVGKKEANSIVISKSRRKTLYSFLLERLGF